MKSYQDKWTRFHDKPSEDGKPSSNNGWIYTAYSKYLEIDTFSWSKIRECYELCTHNDIRVRINRNPNQPFPPFSKDEVFGAVSLGLLNYSDLYWQHNTFCNLYSFKPKPLSKINWFKAIKQFWELRNKHRNAVWQEPGYEEAMQLAFRLAPNDLYYVKRMSKVAPGLLDAVMWHLNALQTTLKQGKTDTQSLSSLNILWLQLKDMKMEDSWYYKSIDQKKNFMLYFGKDHPFNKIEK